MHACEKEARITQTIYAASENVSHDASTTFVTRNNPLYSHMKTKENLVHLDDRFDPQKRDDRLRLVAIFLFQNNSII